MQKYIKDILKKVEHSITTDWLSYCIEKNAKCEVLRDEIITKEILLKNGVPAVGKIFLTDNDFFTMQSDEWKETGNLNGLCSKKCELEHAKNCKPSHLNYLFKDMNKISKI